MTKQETIQNLKKFGICVAPFLGVLGFLSLYYYIVYKCIGTSTGANVGSDLSMGTFGDTFGAANALFSGLAFAGMIIALHQQKKELRMQREVLELQRKDLKLQIKELANTNAALDGQKEEMANQKKELEQQKKIMAEQLHQTSIQQFENAFFFMLGQHNNILNNLSGFDSGWTTLSGIDFIKYWGQLALPSFSENFDRIKFSSTSYVNNLYRIFKYIESSDVLSNKDKNIDFDNKQKYYSIVTSILDYYEMAFLYNYVNTNAYYTDFKELLRKNGLLENMRKTNGRDNSQEFDVKTAKDNLGS